MNSGATRTWWISVGMAATLLMVTMGVLLATVLWVFSMVLAGYTLGTVIPDIEKYLAELKVDTSALRTSAEALRRDGRE